MGLAAAFITKNKDENSKAMNRKGAGRRFFQYMTPGRRLRIAGGWDGTGNMMDRYVELIAPGAEGDRMEKPAYSVRVQVQKNNPLQIQADNEFLTQAAQICAQSGQPLPAESVIGLMEGFRTKSSVLRAVQENSRTQQELAELRAAVEQMTAENTEMKEALKAQVRSMRGVQKETKAPAETMGMQNAGTIENAQAAEAMNAMM